MARPRKFKGNKIEKDEWSYFINEYGNIQYNDLCKKCKRDCKQSFRAQIVNCPIKEL